MTDAAPPDPIRREVVAGAVAVTLTAGIGAAVARAGERRRPAGGGDPTPTTEAAPSARAGQEAAGVGGGEASAPATTTAPASSPAPPSTAAAEPTSTPGVAHRALSAEERRLHVARRLTFGPTPELLAHIEQVGVEAFVAQQLTPESIDDSRCDRIVAPLRTLGHSAAEITRDETGLLSRPRGHAVRELQFATVLRTVYSERQLFEVMVQFWTNHFNIWPGKTDELESEKPVDDWAVIRRNALGPFADLLQGSGHSPAMLRYLDNHVSTAAEPNENYARELLELHTLGAGNYGEGDVLSAARAFSGWTVGDNHRFVFDPSRHAGVPATVAGWSTPGRSGGAARADGESLLAHLARHPATARNLSTKLARHFVADTPPSALVERLAHVYLDHDTDVRPVLAHLFASQEFYDHYGAKLRRPVEFVAASLRISGARIDGNDRSVGKALRDRLSGMGQLPLDWPSPDGYPDLASAWLAPNDVMGRWDFAQRLAHAVIDGVSLNLGGLLGAGSRRTVGEVAARVVEAAVAGPAPSHVRDAVVTAAGVPAGEPFDGEVSSRLPTMFAVALSSAEAQYR